MTALARQMSYIAGFDLRAERWRGLAWGVVVSLTFAPAPGSAQRTPAHVIDSLATAEFEARPIAGLEVAVVQAGDTLFRHSYGMANLEQNVPLGRDGVFQIASITKEFVAAAVFRLVERGEVGLDDDIHRFVPDLDTKGRTVLVRHLLNHSSGLTDFFRLTGWPAMRRTKLATWAAARPMEFEAIAQDPPDFAPGTSARYSNTGFHVLGDMIEKVSGVDLGTFLRREFFEPLGMDETSLCGRTTLIPRRVSGYEPDSANVTLENADLLDPGVLFAAGGLCSTASDLLRWNDALHHGRVVSVASYAAMSHPVGPSGRYGFGLFVGNVDGHRRLGHNGSVPGFSSQLDYFPEDSLAIVVLANSPSAVETLSEDIARAVLGLPPRTTPVRPEGWEVRALVADADTTSINFRTMTGGMHITAGQGALYFHPDSVAKGDFTLRASLGGTARDSTAGHGLIFGGRRMTESDAEYLAFTVRPGAFALTRHRGDTSQAIVPWTATSAVASAANAVTLLGVTVSGDRIVLSVNDTQVSTLPRSRAGLTDGIVGLMIGTGDNFHIDGFGHGPPEPTPGGH